MIKRSSSWFLIPRCSNSCARSKAFFFFLPPISAAAVTGAGSPGSRAGCGMGSRREKVRNQTHPFACPYIEGFIPV